MAPIRVGILGLSASGTSGTSWAERAHLSYLRAADKYELVAVCNSSVESAQNAVRTFGLPDSTKAYGNPEDLANDPDVDLVVCSTRADVHSPTINPSLRKGKNVFCEWPLGANLKEAEESLALARESGAKTMIGLQGRISPIVLKAKELIAKGKIGDVLSTTFLGSPTNGGEDESKALAYMADRKVGGNIATIPFGHTADIVLATLGELDSFNSLLSTQRPKVPVVDRGTNEIVATVDRTSFDNIIIQGKLQSSNAVKPLISYTIRGGKPFPSSQKPLVWNVYGTKGEIQITSSQFFLNVGAGDPELWLYENGKDKAEKIEIPEDEFLKSLPIPGQNIGRLYERYADGKDYPTFEDAVLRHRLIDEAESRADDGSQLRKAEYVTA